jgi:hypothetical protein
VICFLQPRQQPPVCLPNEKPPEVTAPALPLSLAVAAGVFPKTKGGATAAAAAPCADGFGSPTDTPVVVALGVTPKTKDGAGVVGTAAAVPSGPFVLAALTEAICLNETTGVTLYLYDCFS